MAERAVERGEAKIVMTNPECMALPRLRDFLRAVGLCHVAIDEAHCVSEWGETFRPSYLELGRVVEDLDPPCISAFTATASPAVFEAVAARLFSGAPYRLIEADPDRPNISYSVTRTLCREHSLSRLARELPRPLLVFDTSRDGVQILAATLRRRLGSRDVRFYHAGLERAEKRGIEQWFYASTEGILVSTCAYGLGVDKKNIRSVVHYSPPASVEAYLQESGRAGRDGLPAMAVLISSPWDELRKKLPCDPARRTRMEAFLGYPGAAGCRRERLLDLLGSSREGRAPCSGCDRCGGSAREEAEGEEEIRGFIRKNPRRFDAREAALLLSGRDGAGPPSCGFWGSLGGWEEEDVPLAVSAALRLGLAKEIATWPWKGRIAPGPEASAGGSAGLD
jgi:ATP-dependent DNA helicase RecQ